MKLHKIISMLFITINLQYNILNASITIRAEDYPALTEGFALCGRYNLQEFFDQQIEKFDTLDNLKNKSQIDQDNEIDKEMKIFDILSHAIIPAQDLIVEKISKNTVLHNKFCTILSYVIDHDIDLNSQSSSFFITPKHTDKFFQYCICVDFMEPTIQKWILTYREGNIGCHSYSFVERAIELNSSTTMQFLMAKKVDITTADEGRSYDTDHHDYCMNGGKKYYSNNPLCLAILYNANKVIPLFIAAQMHPSQNNNQILIRKKMEGSNIYFPAKSYENNIPLHWAISFHKHIALKALIDAGVDINLQDSKGNTPLHLAAETSNHDAISILLDNGADLYAINNAKKNPWDVAINEETQKLLKLRNMNNNVCHCAIS